MTTTTGMSVKGMAESLNGYDEIAIKKTFGADADELPGTQSLRAMLFVHHRRQGMTDTDAYDAAMIVPMREALDSFEDDEDPDADDRDPMGEGTLTEAGKDAGPPS